jgi:hypothetical protein
MDWKSINHQFWHGYSIKNVVCDACTGKLEIASPEVKEERREICDECEFKNRFGFCRKCGCKVLWKTAVKKSKCPLKKW